MRKGNQRTILGIFFIGVGVALLLGNIGIIPYEFTYYVFTWEMILIAIGVYQLSSGNTKGGLITLTIGSLFWIRNFWNISYRDFWPVILIAIGLSSFLKGRGHKSLNGDNDDSDYIDDLALLGGSKKIVTDQSFKGGRITSIFGGVELDLRNASLEGGKAEIDTFTIFGAFKTYVPPGWKVNTNMTCIFGGFNDKRTNKPPLNAENVLTIKGVVLFGGGDLMH